MKPLFQYLTDTVNLVPSCFLPVFPVLREKTLKRLVAISCTDRSPIAAVRSYKYKNSCFTQLRLSLKTIYRVK